MLTPILYQITKDKQDKFNIYRDIYQKQKEVMMNKIVKMIKEYQLEIKVVSKFMLLLVKFAYAYTMYFTIARRMIIGAYNLANTATTVEKLLQSISNYSQAIGIVVVLYVIAITVYRKQGMEDYFRTVFHYQARMYFIIAVITLFVIGVMNNTLTSYRDTQAFNDMLLIALCSFIAVISNKLYKRLDGRKKMSYLSKSKVLGKARKDHKATYVVDPNKEYEKAVDDDESEK